MDGFRCATCGNPLSVAVQSVKLPAQPHPSLLNHHRVNPPLLAPGTYAVDESAYGRERITGTFVLSPGDVRGTRFVHDLVLIGCWSLVGWDPCIACEKCGTLVAFRADDCHVAQETRFDPAKVVREARAAETRNAPEPFAAVADWDEPAPGVGRLRPRPELTATRWGGRGVKAHLYRDDPPA
ncbi:hypothetical protein ACQP2X_41850 [Actinoplanes sp. CA-131856]